MAESNKLNADQDNKLNADQEHKSGEGEKEKASSSQDQIGEKSVEKTAVMVEKGSIVEKTEGGTAGKSLSSVNQLVEKSETFP